MKTKSGKSLFPIGIGTWNISSTIDPTKTAGDYGSVVPAYGNEDQEIEAIRYSLSLGQNHLDCAELYGGFYTDEVIGQAIEESRREDLYIADKLWKTSVGNGLVRPTVELMLEKLGTDYLDMLYIHSPFEDAPWTQAISQIDKLIDEGMVRDFGVSNFTAADLDQAQQLAKHPIIANQMNYNVLYQDEVDADLSDFMMQQNIQLIAYQPVKRQAVMSNSTIKKIAEAHKATAAQVALSWLLTKSALPIPKSTDKRHIAENVAAVAIDLSPAEIAELDKCG